MGLRKTTTGKHSKCIVSIFDYKNGVRLRWRHSDKRESIYISSSLADYLRIAHIIKDVIHRDLLIGVYETLVKYKTLLEKAALHHITMEHQMLSWINAPSPTQVVMPLVTNDDHIELFNQYLAARGKSEINLGCYYYDARQLLKRWGNFSLDDVPKLMNREKFGNKTFNDRRNCLFQFYEWCVRKQKIHENPLADVSNKKRSKVTDRRNPFSDNECKAIVEGLMNDTYSIQPTYPHSQYWRFVAFLMHTGTRNGEAIGLKVKEVNYETKEIRIAKAFSRTRNGSNMSARILKGTKMENIRFIPMDNYLFNLLDELCSGKKGDEFVFINKNGNPIDDKMFQRRVFRPLLEKLNIERRDLYACRHTFATRAVQQGMKPHEVAYIMGDTVQTVLKNYFHNNQKPERLPQALIKN